MNIINLRNNRIVALMAGGALLMSLAGYSSGARAATDDVTITASANGTQVLAANGSSTVLATFSPDLDLASSTSANIETSGSSATTAYYGVHTVVATSSSDVHWRITISHDTEDLNAGDVTIREVGTYDAHGGKVRGTPATYTTTESGGDLIMNGNISGWSIAAGDDFTNVDEITFAPASLTGTYTITRSLVNESTGEEFSSPFTFTINATAADDGGGGGGGGGDDTTAPDAPVITSPVGPVSTSTNPLVVTGTAEASSTITVTGGTSTKTASTTADGNWNVSVNLHTATTSTLSFTAKDAAGNTSSSTTLVVTHFNIGTSTATSSPVIILLGQNPMQVFACEQYVEPGFLAFNSAGVALTATSTGAPNITGVGTFTATYTATDDQGHTATTTRTINAIQCSSAHGGGSSRPSGNGNSGATAILNPGQVLGAFTTAFPGINPGEILGASSFRFINLLRHGMRGQEVAELQARLHSMGLLKVNPTGYFGNLTANALKAFQRGLGLRVSGEVDTDTALILNNN